MSTIINAKNVTISKKRVLFDTNIWIFLNGFGANSAQFRAGVYSAAYKALIANENTIVLNDYVLSEFFNRCAKMEYDLKKGELERENARVPHFKEYRRSVDFAPVLESIRDTCLNMLQDCEFISVAGHHYDIASIVSECCSACIDFTDLVLVGFCRKENLYMMTDDADYAGSGLDIISANQRMVEVAGHRHR
jgi:hypothetical protein